jgi:hypothetical protein
VFALVAAGFDVTDCSTARAEYGAPEGPWVLQAGGFGGFIEGTGGVPATGGFVFAMGGTDGSAATGGATPTGGAGGKAAPNDAAPPDADPSSEATDATATDSTPDAKNDR